MAARFSSTLKRPSNSSSLSLYDDDHETDTSSQNNRNKKSKPSLELDNNNKVTEISKSSPSNEASGSVSELSTVNSKKDLSCSSTFITACGWRKGERDEMQDRHVIMDSFVVLPNGNGEDIKLLSRSALFGLFDGHAGKLAAEYCASHLPSRLSAACIKYSRPAKDLASVEKAMKKIFVETYKTVDEEFLKEARKHKPTLKDGTTATTLLLLNDVLYCANIGDSRAVVCRHKSQTKETLAMQITVDHSPIIFSERMRIQKAGGTVKDGRVLGVLEVSRSIGDGQFKAHGVSCVPDIKKITLTSEDLFIILACDGLWKCFSSEEAVKFCINRYGALKDKNFEDSTLRTTAKSEDDQMNSVWLKIADELSADAVLRGCGDNVSVVLVVFKQNLDGYK